MSITSQESRLPAERVRSVRPRELREIAAPLRSPDDPVRTVELVGDPGAGKTHLLDALHDDATECGYRVFRGFAAEADHHAPLQALTRALPYAEAEEAVAHLPPRHAAVVDSIWASSATGDIEALRAVLSERAHSARHLVAIRALFQRLVEEQPTALVLDDFHWADVETAAVVDHLVRYPIPGPFVLVLAHRNRQATEWLRGTWLRSTLFHGVQLGTVERIELLPLTAEQSAQLLSLPQESDRARRLHRESRGIPEYLLALDDPRRRGYLLELVHGEIQPLTPDEFTVAESAAVLGDRFDVEALAAVSRISVQRACAAATGLLQRDLMRRSESLAVLEFRHPLISEAVYAGADPCRRRSAHRLALDHQAKLGVSMAARARHVAGCRQTRGEDDVTVLLRGAEEVLRERPHTAIDWVQVALNATTDPARRAEALLLSARALWSCGRTDEAGAALRAVHEPGARAPEDQRLRALAWGALLDGLSGRTGAALLARDRATETPVGPPVPSFARPAIWACLVQLLDGQQPLADTVERAARAARSNGCPMYQALALGLRAYCAAALGQVTAAREALDAVEECAPQMHTDWALGDEVVLLTLTGNAALALGQFSAADARFSRAADLACEQSFQILLPGLLLGRALVHNSTGRLEAAQRIAERAAECGERLGIPGIEAMALTVAASCEIRRRPEWPAELWEQTQNRVSTMRPGTLWHQHAAVLALAAAQAEPEAARAATEMLIAAGGGNELGDMPLRLRLEAYELLARIGAGDRHPALQSWARRADRAARTLDIPYAKALAHCALGHHHRAEGRAEEAEHLYALATALLAAEGMSLPTETPEATALCLSARLATEQNLHLAEDARTRRQVDLLVLTDREREIAGIAGTGVRTKDIAKRLHVSPRTVDAHLNRIYRKLRVTSRTELAWLMADAV
ncbi:AAA family ATPase [Streptomyces sp. NPDC026589]|uniref:helix-turn-helix transcriptional regulator n=1 Tax=Streptomyces sp. NPDC026589 TaxID=3155609 RepID=UPI0033D67260